MDRLIASNSVPFASADTAPATGTPQYATSGNPSTSTPATIFPAYAWNTLQDEIYNVIVGAGLTPDRTKWNQLITAIQTLIQQGGATYATDTSATVNQIVATLTPAPTALEDGMGVLIKLANSITGATTLNLNSLGAEPVLGLSGIALQGGEGKAGGFAYFRWSAGVGSWILVWAQNGALQVAPATQSEHAVQLGQMTGRLLNVQTFTSSGTYTPTVGTTKVIVEVLGGGGAGGGANSSSASVGGGGGGGAFQRALIINPGTQTVTVGAGGTGNSAGTGNSGGTSSFGGFVSCGGGSGGNVGASSSVFPVPGVSGNGATTLSNSGISASLAANNGGSGVVGIVYSNGGSALSGAGGNSGSGSGGGTPVGTANIGGSGRANSGGGGAGSCNNTGGGANLAGGAGGSGLVVVYEYGTATNVV